MQRNWVKVDFEKCRDCGMCETIFPGFRTVYGGMAILDRDSRDLAELARDSCPEKAVYFSFTVRKKSIAI